MAVSSSKEHYTLSDLNLFFPVAFTVDLKMSRIGYKLSTSNSNYAIRPTCEHLNIERSGKEIVKLETLKLNRIPELNMVPWIRHVKVVNRPFNIW